MAQCYTLLRDQARNRRWAHMGEHLFLWVGDWKIAVEKVNQLLKSNGELQCLIPPPIRETHGGLLVWHVERDHRIWSCRTPRSACLNQRHLWTTARFLKETTCLGTATVPPKSPLFHFTRTYLIPGCQCGCRCTVPVQSVPFSPAPTSRDAYTTFWKGRLGGSASCITSQCECFYFHNHPDPWGIQGYNCNCKILIKQGANYACRAFELQRTVNPVNFRKMLHRYHSAAGGSLRSIIGIF